MSMLTNLGSGIIAKVGHLIFNETIIADIHPTPPLPKKKENKFRATDFTMTTVP